MLSRRSFLSVLAGAAVWPALEVRTGSPMRGPILIPDRPWEGTCAMPFGGGIYQMGASWRCYYLANFNRVCVAFSEDGLTWTKPDIGIISGTNILIEIDAMDSFSVVPHLGQWHMIVSQRSGGPLQLFTSKNGLWWTPVATMPWAGDRTTLWFNPVKDRWTFNVRNGGGIGSDPRRIDRVESETFVPAAWRPEPWLKARVEDGADDSGTVQLYAVDVVPESNRLIGLFTLWRGQDGTRPKMNDVTLGVSTDGDVWQRGQQPVLTLGTPGAWNYGNVQSVTGGVHRVGGGYRLYATGRAGDGKGGNGICSLGYREMPFALLTHVHTSRM